jgi:hypothetical protein
MLKNFLKNESGSSLIQASVALILAGVFVGVSLSFFKPVISTQPRVETQAKLDVVRDAMSDFVSRYSRLPCPAPLGEFSDSNRYAREDCSATVPAGVVETDTGRGDRIVWIGALPTRSLGLRDDYYRDGHDKEFVYAVTHAITQEGGFSNDEGGIYMVDGDGFDLTDLPGSALYTVVSTGHRGSMDECLTGGDEENCDSDARFVQSEWALNEGSEYYYDDKLFYSTQEPKNPFGVCGSRGRVYAPEQAAADEDGCLKVMDYQKYRSVRIGNQYQVTCTSAGQFCESEYIDVMSLNPGDYMVRWDGYFAFNFVQPAQYAVLEFSVGDKIYESLAIPPQGEECATSGGVQHETGVVQFEVAEQQDMRARLKFYGGAYDSSTCAGAESSLRLVQSGIGDDDALKSLTVDAFTRYGLGFNGEDDTVVAAPPVGEAIATASAVEGTVLVVRESGLVETVVNGSEIYLGDQIETDSTGSADLAFEDGTTITVSEDTTLRIDQYVYDAGSEETEPSGEATYSLLEGILIYIGGLIDNTDNVSVETPVGSVGIRGTSFMVRHDRVSGASVSTGIPTGVTSVMLMECCVDVTHKAAKWSDAQKEQYLENTYGASLDAETKELFMDDDSYMQELREPYDMAVIQSGVDKDGNPITEDQIKYEMQEFKIQGDDSINPFISRDRALDDEDKREENMEHMLKDSEQDDRSELIDDLKRMAVVANQNSGTNKISLAEIEKLRSSGNGGDTDDGTTGGDVEFTDDSTAGDDQTVVVDDTTNDPENTEQTTGATTPPAAEEEEVKQPPKCYVYRVSKFLWWIRDVDMSCNGKVMDCDQSFFGGWKCTGSGMKCKGWSPGSITCDWQ